MIFGPIYKDNGSSVLNHIIYFQATKESESNALLEIKIKTDDPELMGKTVPLNVDWSTFEEIKRKLFAL